MRIGWQVLSTKRSTAWWFLLWLSAGALLVVGQACHAHDGLAVRPVAPTTPTPRHPAEPLGSLDSLRCMGPMALDAICACLCRMPDPEKTSSTPGKRDNADLPKSTCALLDSGAPRLRLAKVVSGTAQFDETRHWLVGQQAAGWGVVAILESDSRSSPSSSIEESTVPDIEQGMSTRGGQRILELAVIKAGSDEDVDARGKWSSERITVCIVPEDVRRTLRCPLQVLTRSEVTWTRLNKDREEVGFEEPPRKMKVSLTISTDGRAEVKLVQGAVTAAERGEVPLGTHRLW
jgi:hypothetical protein